MYIYRFFFGTSQSRIFFLWYKYNNYGLLFDISFHFFSASIQLMAQKISKWKWIIIIKKKETRTVILCKEDYYDAYKRIWSGLEHNMRYWFVLIRRLLIWVLLSFAISSFHLFFFFYFCYCSVHCFFPFANQISLNKKKIRK